MAAGAFRSQLIARKCDAALLVRQALPTPFDAPSASYLGGLPKLPANMKWPSAKVGGRQRALSFVAQVALADVPRVGGRELLPAGGTLFFFAEMVTGEEDRPLHCAVLHTNEDVANAPVRPPPPEVLATFPDHPGYQLGWLPETDFWRRVAFRYDVSFARIETFFRDGLSGPPDLNGDSEKLRNESLIAALGQPRAVVRDLLARDGDGITAWNDWPSTWLFVKHVSEALCAPVQEKQRNNEAFAAENDDHEGALARAAECAQATESLAAWRARAAEQDDFAPVSHEDAAAFRGAVAAFGANTQSEALRPYHRDTLIWNAVEFCSKLCVIKGRSDLPPTAFFEIAERRTGWRTVQVRNSQGELGQHITAYIAMTQMFGHSLSRQGEQEWHENDILLFQLPGEPGFELYPEMSGAYYFWIKRTQLQARKWDKVVLEGSMGG